jgi:dienelactone hydrolase
MVISVLRIACWLLFSSLVALGCAAAQQAPSRRTVDLTTPDGTILKGTYFASPKPGPGILLLHQCNQQRKLWDVLGERLASSGMNVLTFDYRGFGESGGTPYDKLTPLEQTRIESETWPGDIEVAFRYLLAQPGVTGDRIGAGGASCGVDHAVQLARRHPAVKSLVLLSGPTDRQGRQFLQSSKNLPIFTSAADDDVFGPQALTMQWLFSISPNPSSRFAHYATGGHGAEMFTLRPELPDLIAKWFLATLLNEPESAPKADGLAMDPELLRRLELIDQPGGGGASLVAKTLLAGREPSTRAVLFPEILVNQLGYEHIQLQDTKGAVEILKLNATAYPHSPNAYDSLSDAYLADGQKDLALQNANKAVELLAHDTTDAEQIRNEIRDSAQQKIRQLTPAHP